MAEESYATHLLHLWVGNDEGLYNHWTDRAEEISARGSRNPPSNQGAIVLGDEMKDWFNEEKPDLDGFWADLLNSALADVDWQDVAETFIDAAIEARE